MNIQQAQDFWKLIKFLEVLDRKKFHFGNTVAEWNDDKECGSVCCAVGWLPALFPDRVEWTSRLTVKVKGQQKFGYAETAEYIFGISYNHADALFTPCCQHALDVEEKFYCSAVATPQEVAALMSRYLELYYPEHFATLAKTNE